MNPKAHAAERRHKVYDAIRKFKEAHNGTSPSIRELCALTGITSSSLMNYYLNELERQKVIRRIGFRKSISLAGEQYILPPEAPVR